MRMSDWSSDVCSSDLLGDDPYLVGVARRPRGIVKADRIGQRRLGRQPAERVHRLGPRDRREAPDIAAGLGIAREIERRERVAVDRLGSVDLEIGGQTGRSEEHTSELQSLMRISYAVFCLKKKNTTNTQN